MHPLCIGFILLIGVAYAWNTVGEPIHAVRLNLYQRQYIVVRVGNPGRKLTLRLRWDHDTTYLYERGESYSFTFGSGDEIFYLANVKIRLPITYGLEAPALITSAGVVIEDDRRIDTSGGVTHHGSLGLGPGSFLWRYWTKYTVSRHTLTLGEYDPLDIPSSGQIRIESDGPVDPSVNLRGAFLCQRRVNASQHVLHPVLASEFTYLPIGAYRALQRMLDEAERESAERSRLKASIVISSLQQPDRNNTFWLGVGLTYITTAYGSHERVIRMADSIPTSVSDITMGRLHLLEQHVFFEDKMNHIVRLETAFDSFPLIDSGQAPQGWLTLIALVMYVWWSLETYAMVYQWTMSGLSPHSRRINRRMEQLSDSNQSWFSGRPSSLIGEPMSSTGTNRQADLPPSVYNQPLNAGPIDWNVVPVMLFATRIICLSNAYVSLVGFQSVRFAEQLARMAFLDARLGAVLYYALLGYSVGAVLMVNTYVIRRYTQAAYSLVASALLAVVWLAQQPDTESLFFRLAFNLFFATLFCMRLYEWAFAVVLRGHDSVLSQHITAVGEYNTDAEFLNYESSFDADAKRMMHAVKHSAAQLQTNFDSNSTPLPTLRKRLSNSTTASSSSSKKPTRPLYAKQSALAMLEPFGHGFRAGPADWVMVVLLIVVVLPLASAFLVCINLLPLIETGAPQHPLRIWLSLAYLFLVVIAIAFGRSSSLILQVLREHVLATRRSTVKLYEKAAVELQNVNNK